MAKKNTKKHTSKEKSEKKKKQNPLLAFYLREYKKLLAIPLGLFLFSALVLGLTYARTGEIFHRDVSLKGGLSVTIPTEQTIDFQRLTNELSSALPQASISIREFKGETSGIIIEASDVNETVLLNQLTSRFSDEIKANTYSVETMGSTLGESFFRELIIALTLAFVLMGGVFFYYFRALVPTAAAVVSAFFDIFITLGIITFLGVKLTAGGIAAFLMLIGYSIDTSILISTKMLKESVVDISDNIHAAMKSGLTMSAAGIASTGISFLLSNNTVLRQIMLILVIGLVIDLTTTWIENVGLLRIYLKK